MERHPYHHGDLRRAVLDVAAESIRERGVAALSLRDLARRAGVSHAAPAHHFGDKTGLLTALAAEGFDLLTDSFAAASDPERPTDLAEMGVRFVRFAQAHPAHFQVMYDREVVRADDPHLAAARDRAGRLLGAAVEGLSAEQRGGDPALAATAAWSLAYGFAALCSSGNLDVGSRPPDEVFRSMTGLIFRGS